MGANRKTLPERPVSDVSWSFEGQDTTRQTKTNKTPSEAGDYDYSKQSLRLEEIRKWSPAYAGHFHRAYAGNSRQAAVTAKCLDCTCCQRAEIRQCPVIECPLWPYRPYQ